MKHGHESNDSMPPPNMILEDESNNIMPPPNPPIMTSLSNDDTPTEECLINTTALLEQTFLNLSNQTLLLSKRVSSQTKATIEDSLKLQRELLLRLAPEEQGWKHGEHSIKPPR